jgi:hypothetical protein
MGVRLNVAFCDRPAPGPHAKPLICQRRHQIRALVAAFALDDEDELNGQIGSKRRRHVPKSGSGWQTVNFSAAAAGHVGADVLLDEPGPPGVSHAGMQARRAPRC